MDVPESSAAGSATSVTPRSRSTQASVRAQRFGLALPRRFVLPSLLLLLAERPNYGYNLQQELQDFQLGHIDRPTTYRALSQLEADGMVTSWRESSRKGRTLHVFEITEFGREVLELWMSTILQERDCLARVVHRFQALRGEPTAAPAGGHAIATGDFGWTPGQATLTALSAPPSPCITFGTAGPSADEMVEAEAEPV